MFLITTLTVQAIPSAMTLLLLSRFHFGGGGKSRGTLMQSLLSREDLSLALSSDSAAATASSQQAQLASDVAWLRDEIVRLKAGDAQKAHDIARLQEENARLRAGVATSQQVK